MTRLDWSQGTWLHAPAEIEVSGIDLIATAISGSDAWRHTSYGFVRDDAHSLLAPLQVGQAQEVTFSAAFSEQFDQAGIMVRADAEHWVKVGCELADGVLGLGAVVTLGRSDWSASPVPEWLTQPITLRVSRAVDSLTVRARVGNEPWQLVRLAPFVDGEVQAGPYLCAPTRAGFQATFHHWRLGAADASLH